MFKKGTPVRFRSPNTGKECLSRVLDWGGFTSVREVSKPYTRTYGTTTMMITPPIRYIRLSDLEVIEEIPEKEYFLHSLKGDE